MRLKGLLVLLLTACVVSPASAQVRINEVLPDPGSEFDGAEFIELYNAGGSPVNLTGWTISGTEFEGTCLGEDIWEFPTGTIPAGDYVVIAKDNRDAPLEDQDGYRQRFGEDADFELFDADQDFDFDDGAVQNLTLLTNSSFNDEIGLIPGNGFGGSCSMIFNQYEALYLHNNVGTLIDVFEYRSTLCTTDACINDGQTGNNDAFVGLPGVGESLGRDALGTDTNNASVDLALGTPTPKLPNVANVGPTLSDLAVTNPDPFPGEPVTFSIVATDPEGVDSVYLVFTINGGGPDSLQMTNTFQNTYSRTLLPLSEDDIVRYFVRARDSGNAAGVGVSKFPDFASRGIRFGTQLIRDVQFHSPPTDTGFSAELGNPVNLEGIVTAEQGLYNAGTFVIQDLPGNWNGVHCFDVFATTSVQRGDSVRVAGEVEEFFGLTEVALFGAENVTVLSSGNGLPGPRLTTTSELATLAPIAETLEGVYVRLENLTVTNPALGFGEWEISDGSGTPCRVDDDAFYNYSPTLGDQLVAVEGIVAYSFDNRKLEPRDDGDIIGPPIVSQVRYTPIPPMPAPSPLTVSASITDNGSITRAKLYFSVDNGATYDSLDMVNSVGDTYTANLSSLVGPEIDYHIEVTDDIGFAGRGPAVGDFDLYRGLVTIETIQSTFIAGSDSSAFVGSPRNVAGIVTVRPGMVANNFFVIQNHWTTDPAFRAIAVYTGGSVVGQLELGDSVAVSGDVDEFNDFTEIRLHFTEAFTNYGFNDELEPFELTTQQLPNLPDPPTYTSEPWESVLVLMPNAVVTSPANNFGQYFIDSVDPRTMQDTLVDDEARTSGKLMYQPTVGDSISVRGYVDFAFGDYVIQPRWDADILPYNPADAVAAGEPGAALAFALGQNAPNPASGLNTRIAFALPQTTNAKLRVFDVQGRLVKTLMNGPVEAGRHAVDWNGTNDSGNGVSAGVYFYRLQADGNSLTRKLILLR